MAAVSNVEVGLSQKFNVEQEGRYIQIGAKNKIKYFSGKY